MNLKMAKHEIDAAHIWVEQGDVSRALLHLEFAMDYLSNDEKAVEQKMHPTWGEPSASDSESKPAPKRVI